MAYLHLLFVSFICIRLSGVTNPSLVIWQLKEKSFLFTVTVMLFLLPSDMPWVLINWADSPSSQSGLLVQERIWLGLFFFLRVMSVNFRRWWNWKRHETSWRGVSVIVHFSIMLVDLWCVILQDGRLETLPEMYTNTYFRDCLCFKPATKTGFHVLDANLYLGALNVRDETLLLHAFKESIIHPANIWHCSSGVKFYG